ncbi:putative duf967 domain protein [Golovinomyces cichoracearum]|uniref:Putative duf967 domain protein n=1 Tax=Golovinomyces cichoracearum TaxID=62708 RepID=A0A420HGW9_9PEZI|nr:putative duf967 domain protein [Golovinomyces cichoracearum]
MPSCGLRKFTSCKESRRRKNKANAEERLVSLSSDSGISSCCSNYSSIECGSYSTSCSCSSGSSGSQSNSWSDLSVNSFLQKGRRDYPLEYHQPARDDQLSTILESLEESRRASLISSHIAFTSAQPPPSKGSPPIIPHPFTFSKTSQPRHLDSNSATKSQQKPKVRSNAMSERRSSSVTPKSIRPPPRDLESISRIDASLVFEHFTTDDAWDLGLSLRNRLLPIPTPVVINISLANQNQTVFHSVTHSGVMPDNENWVERKRRTVLRWGCSTWFMACKFGGDEKAFREKYALGSSAGDYAIHGGGIPIRVTGVEGVVAVVVVSGLKQDEDHAVIVEVIKELYY